jgi:hypothetical protein
MNSVKLIFILVVLLLSGSAPCLAQSDANTASARAAYSVPASNWSQKKKAKKKKKFKASTRKEKTRPTEAARQRRRSLTF